MADATTRRSDRRVEHEPAGFIVIRTPILPFDAVESLAIGARGSTCDPAELEVALASDRTMVRGRIKSLMESAVVREALFVASPSLHERLTEWLTSPDSERGLKVEAPLVRYLQRMATRATPFGLFAGCGVGACGTSTRLSVGPADECSRHTRLDMDYLFALTQELNRSPALRPFLVYRPNSSLYRAAGRIRYVEARSGNDARSYHLVALDPDDYLEAVLEASQDGAKPADLAEVLVCKDPEISPEDAIQFIDELIDSQVLVSNLWPQVTGTEPIHGILEQLQNLPEASGTQPVFTALQHVSSRLAEADRSGLGLDTGCYLDAATSLATVGPQPKLARLFQVDLVKGGAAPVLGEGPIREMLRGVAMLHRISPVRPRNEVTSFCEQFVERYESREIPLVVALDQEIGLGTADASNGSESPLLAGLNFPSPVEQSSETWNARHAWLLGRLEETWRTGALQLALTETDLKALENPEPLPLPDAFAIRGAIAAPSAEAIERGDYRVFLETASGPSGANLLGRFCHGDSVLDSQVRALLAREEQLVPDAVFAEIVHLPEGRIGNVLLRPVLREHEIPFLGQSGAPRPNQIPVEDLMVSVVSGRVMLRSKRLGCRVIPRLSTAHNYQTRALRVYRFLCSLQHQGVCGGLMWEWGPLERCSFLPRVTQGRLVLSRARWVVTGEELKKLKTLGAAARFDHLQALRRARSLPRFVVVPDGDNELMVDLDNVLSIEAMADLLHSRASLVLTEMLPGADELCSAGPEGRYVHEVILPVVKKPAAEQSNGVPRVATRPRDTLLERSFPPGSEWLYVKLYCGIACADRILQEMIAPLVRRLLGEGAIDKWFFIRYGDPHWHLRLRLHGPGERLASEALPAIHAAAETFLRNGSIWRLQADTYERELERYGGREGIELAEAVFWHDSSAVVDIVSMLGGDEGADARWRLTLCGIDHLLDGFGLPLAAKVEFVDRSWNGYSRESHAHKQLHTQVGERFRKVHGDLETLLEPSQAMNAELSPALEVLRQRSERLRPIADEIRQHADKQCVDVSLLIGSFAHMYANRLLRSSGRRHEMVLYDFLGRMYRSQLSRSGHKVARRSS